MLANGSHSADIVTEIDGVSRQFGERGVLRADVPLAIDVLADILSDPTFDPEELRREQNVIVQEIGATEDAPDDLVFDYLQATAFPSQPMGRSILGTPATVCSFKDDNLRTYLAPLADWLERDDVTDVQAELVALGVAGEAGVLDVPHPGLLDRGAGVAERHAQRLGKQRTQDRLLRRPRRPMRMRGSQLRLRQRPAVELAVRRQRQPLQHHERRRHHVVRQALGKMRAQCRSIRSHRPVLRHPEDLRGGGEVEPLGARAGRAGGPGRPVTARSPDPRASR